MFINSSMSIEGLAIKISEFLEIKFDSFLSIESEFFTIDILKNKEFDKEKAKEFPAGFLYFPYFLDIDSTKDTKKEKYIKMVGDLMLYLWDNQCQIVVSSDFEEDLPRKGGYNQTKNY